MNNTITARDFGIQVHGEQKYSEFPYSHHLKAVHDVLLRFGVADYDILRAAWLHDALEDTPTTWDDICALFGVDVADLVEAVTNESGCNRKERAIKTYPKIRKHGAKAVILKVADRIANTEVPGPKFKMYQREFPEFSTALFASGECDAMWAHLRKISE